MAGLAAVSTVGMAVLLCGLALVIVNLTGSVSRGALADANPWGASTPEWSSDSLPE